MGIVKQDYIRTFGSTVTSADELRDDDPEGTVKWVEDEGVHVEMNCGQWRVRGESEVYFQEIPEQDEQYDSIQKDLERL